MSTEVISELVGRMVFEVDARPVDKFGEAADKAEQEVEGLGEANDATTVKTVALGNVLATAATRLFDFGVKTAKAAIAGIKDIIFETSAAADAVAKLSKQLGVDAEQLQRLGGAADLSGASMQSLQAGVRALTLGLGDAKMKGTGPVIEGFDALGISVGEVETLLAEGQIEDAVGLIGDAFNETGESAERNAALLKIFGASAGPELRPLLEAGSDGIAGMGDQISATGEVIANDALPEFENLQDQMRLMQGRVQGVKNQIAGALAPTIADISERFGEWIDENQELINQDLPELLAAVADLAAEIIPWVVEVIREFKNFYTEMSQIDERLTQDWGPAWTTTKELIWRVMDPLKAIFAFVGRMIDRVDRLIGRFQTVGSAAAAAAEELGLEVTTDVRGGARVGETNEQREARLTGQAEDRQRIEGAEAQEAADRARRQREEAQAAQGFARSTLRQANAKKKKLTAGDIRAMRDAGVPQGVIDQAVQTNAEVLARKKPGGGGGGRGKRAAAADTGPTIEDLVGNVGSSTATARRVEGGGAGPGLGGTFNTIDQSYKATTNITVELNSADTAGMGPEGIAGLVAQRIRSEMERRDQRIFDHYTQQVAT